MLPQEAQLIAIPELSTLVRVFNLVATRCGCYFGVEALDSSGFSMTEFG